MIPCHLCLLGGREGNTLTFSITCTDDLNITDKKCVNINAFYLANAAVNISTDFLTYTLPIKMVTKLQMPKRQKIGLGVMMSLGFL